MAKEVKGIAGKQCSRLILRKLDPRHSWSLPFFDGSFAKEPGCKSQAGFITVVTTKDMATETRDCCIIEFQSITISRVVKSTMAAESASLSAAVDRHLYVRLLLESMLFGEPEDLKGWRYRLKIPGVMVTDAKSLSDHLRTTGSIPKDRETLIHLLVTRDLVETKVIDLKWMPTTLMVADAITQEMTPSAQVKRLLEEGRYSLAPTEDGDAHEHHQHNLSREQRQRRKDCQRSEKGRNQS